MGKKKKQFIDKKNAANFNIVQRTQRGNFDDETIEGSKFVLQPTNYDAVIPADFPLDLLQLPPEAEPEPDWSQFGGGGDDGGEDVEDDDYDYEQHMKPIQGDGTFFSDPKAEGQLSIRATDATAETKDDGDDAERLFSDKAETMKKSKFKVDKDFFDALEGDDCEEIADDFVFANMQAGEYDEDEDNDSDEGDEGDEGDDEDEEETEEVAREKRTLDQQFDNLMLAEYDSEEDNIGELDPQDPRLHGMVENIEQYKEEIAEFEDRMEQNYGQTKTALTQDQTTLAHGILAHAEATMEPDEEGEAAIGRGIDAMFPKIVRDNWDCESVLTTLTNTENHPNIIKVPRKDKSKYIKLSGKHGMPVEYLPQRDKPGHKAVEDIAEEADGEGGEGDGEGEEDEEMEPVDEGARRNKDESKEDKKARKEAVKVQRKEARDRKRNLKGKYAVETQKQTKHDFSQKVHNSAHKKL